MQKEKLRGIVIDDLFKIYKRGKIEVVALRGLTCEFDRGNLSVIMGPSGCGKTTLLNLIGGLDIPSSGRIIFENENVSGKSEKELEIYRKTKVGYVFQFMNLIPELNAAENVGLPLLLTNVSKRERENRINELLNVVGLFNREKHMPDELSGGEQQRVAIAAALAHNPDILLCDEPTGELDTESKYHIMDVLRNVLKKYPQKIVLVVTHDSDLRKIADKLYFIKDGEISFELNREEIIEKYGDSVEFNAEETIASERFFKDYKELEYLIRDKLEKFAKEK
ncbi:MAG: ABC transporter ATP-binding protein [Candidatus Lokiarchaeota archaeon]|nr:ABC transporter ATP-binding protein [Candidatus Lokiarchaeota archaeon]